MIIRITIFALAVVMIFDPKFDWDKENKILFLWFDWGRKRKYIKLYEQN
jgi:hypothetical protein